MSPHLPPLIAPDFCAPELLPPKPQADQHIQLWLLDIRQFNAAHYAAAEHIMSAAEQARASRLKRGKQEYLASRWLLRKVLARCTGASAHALEFQRTDKGKPYLAHSDIQFSLSHSGHWALLALGRAELIGVDLEQIKPARNFTGIAEHYYHPAELIQLQALAEHQQADYFYRLWTLKEAFFKATGLGISAGLEKLQLALDKRGISAEPTPELAELIARGAPTRARETGQWCAQEWHFHQWALAGGEIAALSYRSAAIQQLRWVNALEYL